MLVEIKGEDMVEHKVVCREVGLRSLRANEFAT